MVEGLLLFELLDWVVHPHLLTERVNKDVLSVNRLHDQSLGVLGEYDVADLPIWFDGAEVLLLLKVIYLRNMLLLLVLIGWRFLILDVDVGKLQDLGAIGRLLDPESSV